MNLGTSPLTKRRDECQLVAVTFSIRVNGALNHRPSLVIGLIGCTAGSCGGHDSPQGTSISSLRALSHR